jgi:hypothetical protein
MFDQVAIERVHATALGRRHLIIVRGSILIGKVSHTAIEGLKGFGVGAV